MPCLKLLCSQPPANLSEGACESHNCLLKKVLAILCCYSQLKWKNPELKTQQKFKNPHGNIIILLANPSWRRREYVYFIHIDGPRTSHNRFSHCVWLRGETINVWEAEWWEGLPSCEAEVAYTFFAKKKLTGVSRRENNPSGHVSSRRIISCKLATYQYYLLELSLCRHQPSAPGLSATIS